MKIMYKLIKVGWLKRWWHLEPERPDWAELANEITYQNTHQKQRIPWNTVKEWISQMWKVKT